MSGIRPGSTRGILRAELAGERFDLARTPPPAPLAPFVAHFWTLTWDLRGRPPHRQQVLTRPAVHLTFTSYVTGRRTRARIVGVVREFTEEIGDEGWVAGAAFRPGGFRPYLGAPVSTLTDRVAGVEEVFGPAGRRLRDAVFGAGGPAAAAAVLRDFLLARRPAPDPAAEEVAAVVARIAAEPSIARVAQLAELTGTSPRRLQRLFAEYVGVSPKWVIRRFRMQEAAERAADGPDGLDLAALAAELGYADQAHLTREFTATIGVSPARYARQCAPERAGTR